jgi:uncharacterized protein
MVIDQTQATVSDVANNNKDESWQVLPDAARKIFALTGCIWSTLIGLGIAIVGGTAAYARYHDWWAVLQVAISIVILAMFYGVWLGNNNWRYTQWKLDREGLHVLRGRWWKRQTLVPHSRVQHLDIERGPLERRTGLASLNVHTAGTRAQAVTVPGLLDADAVALRNALVPREVEAHDDDVSA